jgi:hypothetical protein
MSYSAQASRYGVGMYFFFSSLNVWDISDMEKVGF